MRLSSSFIAASLASIASTVTAASTVAQVYIFDRVTEAPPSTDLHTVAPEDARLIFAQRLGLDRFYTLNDADERLIQQLNSFGRQAPIVDLEEPNENKRS